MFKTKTHQRKVSATITATEEEVPPETALVTSTTKLLPVQHPVTRNEFVLHKYDECPEYLQDNGKFLAQQKIKRDDEAAFFFLINFCIVQTTKLTH